LRAGNSGPWLEAVLAALIVFFTLTEITCSISSVVNEATRKVVAMVTSGLHGILVSVTVLGPWLGGNERTFETVTDSSGAH
jgi:hypothetical protein